MNIFLGGRSGSWGNGRNWMSENMQFAMLVVATGLIVVFGALVLSTFLIYLYGKIITFAQGKASGRRKKSGEKK